MLSFHVLRVLFGALVQFKRYKKKKNAIPTIGISINICAN